MPNFIDRVHGFDDGDNDWIVDLLLFLQMYARFLDLLRASQEVRIKDIDRLCMARKTKTILEQSASSGFSCHKIQQS